MPTYEYKCPECKDTIELMHAMNYPRVLFCPKCKIEMNKGFGGGTGVHFKGSGFYETDYKNK